MIPENLCKFKPYFILSLVCSLFANFPHGDWHLIYSLQDMGTWEEARGAGGCVMERPWHPLRKEGPAWQDPKLFSWFNAPEDILFPPALGGLLSLNLSLRVPVWWSCQEAARLPLGNHWLSLPLMRGSRCMDLEHQIESSRFIICWVILFCILLCSFSFSWLFYFGVNWGGGFRRKTF